MVEPLSKRSQLLSQSFLTLAMFLGPLHWVSGLGFKKQTFCDVFRLWEPHLGMSVECLLVSEGSNFPSLLFPLTFKLVFRVVLLRSFRQSFTRWSGLQHPIQFLFFFWYSSTTLAKQTMYPCDWSAPLTPPKVSGSSPSYDSTSFAFVPKPLATPLLSIITDLAVKVWLPFNFWKGNKFPDVWEWATFDPPIGVVY